MRHWAILGLLMLEDEAIEVRDRLAAAMRADPAPQNQIVAAEAVARLAPSPEAIAILARLADEPNSMPVRLQALNALTFLGEQARPALPVVERAAGGDDEVLRNAGRYLAAVLTGRYEPSYPVFDLEWFRRNYKPR